MLVRGIGSVGGYLAASGASALLQPIYSWRVRWLLNLPTGLSLALLGALIPESAQFLLARGQREEAQAIMRRFGSEARHTRAAETVAFAKGPSVALTSQAFAGKLFALCLAAICYGLINFGLLLWLPADLVSRGYSTELSSAGRADHPRAYRSRAVPCEQVRQGNSGTRPSRSRSRRAHLRCNGNLADLAGHMR